MPKTDRTKSQTPANWRRTLRLTFSYEGAKVRLASTESVEMVPPPPEPTPLKKGVGGFWCELTDASGGVLYQRVLHNPIQFDREVYEDEVAGTIRRVPVAKPAGTFVVLVPDIPDAASVRLVSSPLDPERAGEPATELATFSLKQPGKGKGSGS